MGYPWSAHDILTASDLNDAIASAVISTGLGAWTSYTPTWTASTTNPAIGNGTITGSNWKAGRLLVARFAITMGSTTTYGSGAYIVSLPQSMNATATAPCAVVGCYDSSAGKRYHRIGTYFTGTTMVISSEDGTLISSSVPFTWASGDVLSAVIIGEAGS